MEGGRNPISSVDAAYFFLLFIPFSNGYIQFLPGLQNPDSVFSFLACLPQGESSKVVTDAQYNIDGNCPLWSYQITFLLYSLLLSSLEPSWKWRCTSKKPSWSRNPTVEKILHFVSSYPYCWFSTLCVMSIGKILSRTVHLIPALLSSLRPFILCEIVFSMSYFISV